jgi:hypothetical protein
MVRLLLDYFLSDSTTHLTPPSLRGVLLKQPSSLA